MARVTLPIEGMTCNSCAETLRRALAKLPGVAEVSVSFPQRRAMVEIAADGPSPDDLAAAVAQAGYRVTGAAAPHLPLVELQLSPPASSKEPAEELDPALSNTLRVRSLGDTIRVSKRKPAPEAPETPAPAVAEVTLNIEGMHCASCVGRVENALASAPGVVSAHVNLTTEQARVEIDPAATELSTLVKAVERSGYRAKLVESGQPAVNWEHSDRERRAWGRRVVAGLLLLAPLVLAHFGAISHFVHGWMALALATVLQAYLGWPFYVGAWRRLKHASTNMDTLVAIGATAAYGAGVAALLQSQHVAGQSSQGMEFMDAGMILTFITLGKYLEARAKGRASSAIRKLLDLSPPEAVVLRDGRPTRESVHSVAVGDVILVRPGEKVPLDAEVTSGSSAVDQSWLSGESIPVDKRPGDSIFAGTINQQAALTARVTRLADNTSLAQVVRLVQRAQESKAGAQRLADRVIAYFVPAVLVIAATTLVAWLTLSGDVARAVSAAVAVLVVACPCALGLATPTAILVASGRGAEKGILIKDARALEAAGELTTVVLDKTGTVTEGRPKVTQIVSQPGVAIEEVLSVAAGAEHLSEHPLAAPIVAEAEARHVPLAVAQEARVVAGGGIYAALDGGLVFVGNERLMREHQVDYVAARDELARLRANGETPLLVARGAKLLGIIAVADQVAPHSAEAIRSLHALGLSVRLLTGDHRLAAEAVARAVGIDKVSAEVLPQDKEKEVRRLRERGEVVAMVGDGINDAPALAAADLGIAIGSGADVAIETADLVLMRPDLRLAADAVRLARATVRTIRQNLGWAFVYNLLLLPLAAGVLAPIGFALPPVAAAAAMALSSVSVVGNSLLLRARVRNQAKAGRSTP